MKKLEQICLMIALPVFLASCEEVIEIDLNSSNPVLVAEGYMEQDSLCRFTLRYTSDYFSNSVADEVEDAIIRITDGIGNSEQLAYQGDGLYRGQLLRGTSREEYNVELELDGKLWTGSSTLLPAPEIASIAFEEMRMGPASPDDETSYMLVVDLVNDPKINSSFMLKIMSNGELVDDSYQLATDRFNAGSDVITYFSRMLPFHKGELIDLEIYAIDEEAYAYYSQVNEGLGGAMALSSTPFNPASNLGEDILGYFMARSMIDTTFMVP